MTPAVAGFSLGTTYMRDERASTVALPLYLDYPICTSRVEPEW